MSNGTWSETAATDPKDKDKVLIKYLSQLQPYMDACKTLTRNSKPKKGANSAKLKCRVIKSCHEVKLMTP